MDKQLRIIAGQIVVESKLSKSAKMQLLNFIKEDANDAQIKALLMDGKIINLDKQAEQIVNDRFAISESGTIKTIKEYINHLQEYDEILTFSEYVIINNLVEKKRLSRRYRELEPVFLKSLKVGLIPAFMTGAGAAAGGASAGVGGAAIGSYIGGLIGAIYLYPMWLYRTFTDICVRKCTRATDKTFCYNKCYYDAVIKVITVVKKEMSNTSKIKDVKKREKVKRKLSKELNKWKEKEKLYKERLSTRTQNVKINN